MSLEGAASAAGYLARLGVSHLYTSPVLQAAPGSTHGYDVVDHSGVSTELGGEAARDRLVSALDEAGLGMVLDVVPNHMAIAGRHNRWWWDVLENGPSSRFASAFDIAWESPDRRLRNIILMPTLGDHYGRVLERSELRLEREGGSMLVRYHEHEFPVAIDSLDGVLRAAATASGTGELAELAERCSALPELDPEQIAEAEERHQEKEAIKEQLAALCAGRQPVAAALDRELAAISADPDRLDGLLSRQHYRLARWQTASSELDYRRFFDIHTLVGLRMEDERIFHDTHELVLRWLQEGRLQGLRVDHVDGLRDPEGYLRRLQLEAPGTWVVVEKILGRGEGLPGTWPVAGTTGYDFCNLALGLFVDPRGEGPLTELWESFTGDHDRWEDVAHRARHEVMRELLAADLFRLADALVRVCERNRRFRDFTRQEVLSALHELMACLPVYRTYVRPDAQEVSDEDRAWLHAAVTEARERRPDLDPELFDFVVSVVLLQHRGKDEAEFVSRFQQTSGPVMAKGVEDTAMYRYHRLTCLNEVGGDPARFGVSVDEFHDACIERARRWPLTMLASSSHDTKRSEDVRCRLALLSEIPDRWERAVAEWAAHNTRHRQGSWPDPQAEYLLYQTLVGAWPISLERIQRYMQKAVREAKRHTSWLQPNAEYEEALLEFVQSCLGDRDFRVSLEEFVQPLLPAGWVTSLALKLLTLTAPGIPDVYQGTELWDLSLVDPDNRRPVDLVKRAELLDGIDRLSPEACWEAAAGGLPKLLVTSRALGLRRRKPEAFAGAHQPLAVDGEKSANLIAYARGGDVVVLAPRLVMGLVESTCHTRPPLGAVWADTTVELPAGTWHDELGGGTTEGGVRAARSLLGAFPVALLSR